MMERERMGGGQRGLASALEVMISGMAGEGFPLL